MKNLLYGRSAAGVAIFLATIIFAGAVFFLAVGYFWKNPAAWIIGGSLVIVGIVVPRSLVIANQWERLIVLRLGRFTGAKGPGLFFIIPWFDVVAASVDQRIQTTAFNAERTLTRTPFP